MEKYRNRYGFLLMMLCIWMLTPSIANAQTVVPASGDVSGRTDYNSIANALDLDGNIVLESGKTYYLSHILYVKSNQSIKATGATVVTQGGALRNTPTEANYQSIENFTVDGGTWKRAEGSDFDKSFVQFSHGKNIKLKNMKIYSDYKGHGIELIACKNVVVDQCILQPEGKCDTNSVEEALQIDLATPVTAPTLAAQGTKFVKGQVCENITVKNCTITGGRGVCANYAAQEKKYQNRFHKNIILKNNKITGEAAEAVALFNVMGATVEGNTLVSKSKRTSTAYSVGLHIACFGKAPASMKKTVYKVNSNTIKGGRQGFYVYSHSSSKFGSVIAHKNKCYAKAGAGKAIQVTTASVVKTDVEENKSNKWK